MICSLLLQLVGLLHRLTLWSGGMKPKIVLHRWHFGMLELQPVYLLVTALGSRLAVASKHLTLRLQHVAEDPAA